jgi:hypothetical protein
LSLKLNFNTTFILKLVMDSTFDVNISSLIFDQAIKNEVEKTTGKLFPYKVTIIDNVPLTKKRLLSLMELYHKDLPTIRITPSGRILDGRHRVASAIIRGETSIRATYDIIIYCESSECYRKMILANKKSSDKESLCIKCYTEKCCRVCHIWCGESLCEECEE